MESVNIDYGIRRRGQQLFMGNSGVQFYENNTLIVKNKSIQLTPRLIEFIFKSDPLERLMNESDLKVYKDLVRTSHKTNASQYSKGIPGTPGVGFKLISDGQFELDGKRSCNGTKAIA
ncbi:hypothetical protein KQX54_014019 [Cotesia glomerata]|uniref:DUF8207 domain-containing protein n=1 Tax=Cotesia glomerata TaxID=32391 RepID=A0AAV7I918_COTGL|nr:hypothetical protein KQX54_014019 [Cotesia glomerata]